VKRFASIFCLLTMLAAAARGGKETAADSAAPTCADAAVIVAKYMGFFDRYLGSGATLSECVAFLNAHGVRFEVEDVVTGKTFSSEDCARVLGQVALLLGGNARLSGRSIELEKGFDSWSEFCTMRGIDYKGVYRSMTETIRSARGKRKAEMTESS